MEQDKGKKNGDDDNGEENGDEVEIEVKLPKLPRDQEEYDPGPPASRTRDESSHHSSPQPSQVQQPQPPISGKYSREITGGTPRKVEVPMHVTKHPEPRGRPRETNEG